MTSSLTEADRQLKTVCVASIVNTKKFSAFSCHSPLKPPFLHFSVY